MSLSVTELDTVLQSDQSTLLIDVRMPIEHRERHIAGSILSPIEELDVDEVKQLASKYDRCVVYCLSGKRSEKAQQLLVKGGCENIDVLDGGIRAWSDAGLPLVESQSKRMSIMRQVQLIVATGVTAGLVLAFTIDLWFLVIPIFFALGVTFAGITGKCGMAYILAKMPWNRGASCSWQS